MPERRGRQPEPADHHQSHARQLDIAAVSFDHRNLTLRRPERLTRADRPGGRRTDSTSSINPCENLAASLAVLPRRSTPTLPPAWPSACRLLTGPVRRRRNQPRAPRPPALAMAKQMLLRWPPCRPCPPGPGSEPLGQFVDPRVGQAAPPVEPEEQPPRLVRVALPSSTLRSTRPGRTSAGSSRSG